MDTATIMPTRHKLDTDRYFRMAEAGIFAKEERIELIEGDLIDMAPIGQDHAGFVSGLMQAFVLACAGRATVWTQSSIWLSNHTAPEPDITVLRLREDFYASGERPGPADILLVAEIAKTSLEFDRTVKLPLYAEAGVAELWIVDVQRRIIEVHRQPIGSMYRELTTFRPGEPIALALAPEIVVALDPVFAAL